MVKRQNLIYLNKDYLKEMIMVFKIHWNKNRYNLKKNCTNQILRDCNNNLV